jgi:hypothetical protein
MKNRIGLTALVILNSIICLTSQGQGTGRYWDQNFNSEAALLSGAVVAGEGGIAAIYYNPATITDMKKNNLSLSANLFSVYFFKADNALGLNLPGDRVQFDVYPRIITLTLNPEKIPELTIEMAFFTKSNEYLQINSGTSLTSDIIISNPGNEIYTGEYYLRSKFQDYNGGVGFGYKVSDNLSLGMTTMISYKDDQYYNSISTNAFSTDLGTHGPYLSSADYLLKYNMYDVRLVTKLGIRYKTQSMSMGANINLPSLKLFGNGTVYRQYEYSNIHIDPSDTEGSNLYYAGRQTDCKSHFKDPLSVSAGLNLFDPTGNSTLLFTAEYFFGLSSYQYIEAFNDPGKEGYDFTPVEAGDWLSFIMQHKPVFDAGIAFKQRINDGLMFSGGFRTDFRYVNYSDYPDFLAYNKKSNYNVNVYHFNYGLNKNFKRGFITLGMQFSYGQENNQRQIVNLIEPVEYINSSIMPLTGNILNNVTVRYLDISVYFGFLFNFMK